LPAMSPRLSRRPPVVLDGDWFASLKAPDDGPYGSYGRFRADRILRKEPHFATGKKPRKCLCTIYLRQ
jgi:hypothetical protein